MSMTDDTSTYTKRDATYFIIVNALYQALPPAILTSPEALRLRIDGAIAMVASLVPVNQAEAMLATNWVVTTMQAMDSQAAAHQPSVTREWKMKSLAQANSMQRNAKGLLEQLRQMQVLRMKREGMEPSPDQAAWIEHCVGETMQSMFGTMESMLAGGEQDQKPTHDPDNQDHETVPTQTDPPNGDLDQNPIQSPVACHHETNTREAATPPRPEPAALATDARLPTHDPAQNRRPCPPFDPARPGHIPPPRTTRAAKPLKQWPSLPRSDSMAAKASITERANP